jgi:hypothetical protein
VTERRCSICAHALVSEVDALLASGTSARQVARMYALARSTLARHARHVPPGERPFAVIRGDDGPTGAPDPLSESFALAARARTPRERLRALEQVRGATRLALRGLRGEVDELHRDLLDSNVASAQAAYRDAPDFETAARALSGWREALLARLEAVRSPGSVAVPIRMALADGEPLGDGGPWQAPAEVYWRGVPRRFRDPERFAVQRILALRFGEASTESVQVYERASGALAWTG